MEISIRKERADEHWIVENIIYHAFLSEERPDCNEHLMVHQLRQSKDFISELGLVAEINGKIVGNVICTLCRVVDENNNENYKDIIAIGPIGVLPYYQKQGIGSLLVKAVQEKAHKMGFLGIILYGHPNFYKKFGFVNAEKYKLSTPDNSNFDAFMAYELYVGSLENISGRCFESDAFETDSETLKEFNKKFI